MTRKRLDDLARTIIDSNRYMALGTGDPNGHRGCRPSGSPPRTTGTSSGLIARR